MAITLQHFREILDDMEISHKIYKEVGLLEFVTSQTEPFEADFKFLFFVSEERNSIQAHGLLCSADLDDRNDFNAAYRFCNKWNDDKIMPKAIVKEKEKYIICEWSWDMEFEITDSLLKSLIIAQFVKTTEACIQQAVEAGLYPSVIQTPENPE